VLAAGYQVVYSPSALEYHTHRREADALYKQVHAYGMGFTAYLLSVLLQQPRLLLRFGQRLPANLFRLVLAKRLSATQLGAAYPADLRNAEIRGMVSGVRRYIQGRRRARRIARHFGPLDLSSTPP
jgi:hypothetical protein